jgi:hypothetical protein
VERQAAGRRRAGRWNDFSAPVRGDVINAESVREANAALREHLAAIHITCGNTPHTGRRRSRRASTLSLKEPVVPPTHPFWCTSPSPARSFATDRPAMAKLAN